jgi:hypothetical protein
MFQVQNANFSENIENKFKKILTYEYVMFLRKSKLRNRYRGIIRRSVGTCKNSPGIVGLELPPYDFLHFPVELSTIEKHFSDKICLKFNFAQKNLYSCFE